MGGLLADNEDAHGEVDDSTPKNRDPATTESDGVVSSGVTPSEPKKASWLLVALLFWCGVGTFARTEVFVLQTRYFSLCAGYGKVRSCVHARVHVVPRMAACGHTNMLWSHSLHFLLDRMSVMDCVDIDVFCF